MLRTAVFEYIRQDGNGEFIAKSSLHKAIYTDRPIEECSLGNIC